MDIDLLDQDILQLLEYWDKNDLLKYDETFFFHERLPNLSNSKNKSFFGSKIANSFNFKDFAIFQ